MSSEVAIRAQGLGKAYQVYARPQDRLKQMLMGRGGRRFYNEFWALRDVDLEIRKGETVGIVGRNGSGKSTLLQMICGTLEPTQGELVVSGRVAALLELGAGFNPEFTGRDNVYLNAQILGMSSEFVQERFDRIAAFADIGEHLEQPVKTYSSGMYARLAFAVAIHVDPQILVVDEALSVGDEAFQRKCFGRIREIRDAGATVLFVSHSASIVIELCDRAVLLDHGRRLITGRPKAVVGKYQKLMYAPAERIAAIQAEIRQADEAERALELAGEAGLKGPLLKTDGEDAFGVTITRAPNISGVADMRRKNEGEEAFYDPSLVPKSTVNFAPRGARLIDPKVLDLSGVQVNVLLQGETYLYSYRVCFDEPAFQVRFGMMIKTVIGFELGGLVTHNYGKGAECISAGETLEITIPFECRLAPSVYFLNAGVVGAVNGEETFLHRLLDAVMIRVMLTPGTHVTGFVDFSNRSVPAKWREVSSTDPPTDVSSETLASDMIARPGVGGLSP